MLCSLPIYLCFENHHKIISSSKPQHDFIYNNLLQTNSIAFKISSLFHFVFLFCFCSQTRKYSLKKFSIFFLPLFTALLLTALKCIWEKMCFSYDFSRSSFSKFSFFFLLPFSSFEAFFFILCSHNSCHIHENIQKKYLSFFFLHSVRVCVFVRMRDTLLECFILWKKNNTGTWTRKASSFSRWEKSTIERIFFVVSEKLFFLIFLILLLGRIGWK